MSFAPPCELQKADQTLSPFRVQHAHLKGCGLVFESGGVKVQCDMFDVKDIV